MQSKSRPRAGASKLVKPLSLCDRGSDHREGKDHVKLCVHPTEQMPVQNVSGDLATSIRRLPAESSVVKTYPVSLPFIGLITGTRAMAAGGLALLLADKLDVNQRKAVGWTLFAVGLATTIPLGAMLFGCCGKEPRSQQPA